MESHAGPSPAAERSRVRSWHARAGGRALSVSSCRCDFCSSGGRPVATVERQIFIKAQQEAVWDAVCDIGALHTRLVPGFVVDTKLEGESRVVTFGNGMVVREPIISVDSERLRIAWGAEGGALTHYNASLQLHAERGGTRVVWTSDLLPHAMAEQVAGMQEQGLAVMKKTLEQRA